LIALFLTLAAAAPPPAGPASWRLTGSPQHYPTLVRCERAQKAAQKREERRIRRARLHRQAFKGSRWIVFPFCVPAGKEKAGAFARPFRLKSLSGDLI
jgi:hypothetical protein